MQNSMTIEQYVAAEAKYLRTGDLPEDAIKAMLSCEPPVTTSKPTLTPGQIQSILDESTRDHIAEFTMVPTSWQINEGPVSDEVLCIVFEYENIGRVDESAPLFEFSLVGPSGQIKMLSGTALDGGSLGIPPEVIPGTKGSADACFVTDRERGTYTIRREDPFYDHSDEWTITVP
jgi:hypothetical protein